jgi:hypothetical protein
MEFNWGTISLDRRRSKAKQWFTPFKQFSGTVKNSKLTGKPHYYIRMNDGSRTAVTYKRTYYIIHPNAPSGAKGIKMDKHEVTEWLISNGAILR